MKVLAIETSTQNCSVSIQGDGVDVLVEEVAPQAHARLILPMIEQALAEADLVGEDLDFLAFGEGPGAFTGLRIAAGVVQGLALGWNKPVVAISTLEALAMDGFLATGTTSWTALLDARMQEVYWANFEFNSQGEVISSSKANLTGIQAINFKNFAGNGVGDVFEVYPEIPFEFKTKLNQLPSAKPLARLALSRFAQAKFIGEQVPQPLYLRASVS